MFYFGLSFRQRKNGAVITCKLAAIEEHSLLTAFIA